MRCYPNGFTGFIFQYPHDPSEKPQYLPLHVMIKMNFKTNEYQNEMNDDIRKLSLQTSP